MKWIFSAFLTAVFLTGCSSNGRVNEKAYLRAASLDGDRMTFVFYSEDDETVSVSAEAPEDAKKKAEIAVGKEIFTGHTELLILNDCDNSPVLEYMLHKWNVSPSCMVVRDKKNGEKMLRERSVEDLTGAVRCAQKQGLAPECSIIDVLSEELRTEAQN